MIGGAVGNILGSVLGVPPTPEAVDKAIKETSASELQDKLAAAEADAQAKYPALAEIAKAEAEAQARTAAETQLTMRAELAAGDPLQRWWRPLYGLELTPMRGARHRHHPRSVGRRHHCARDGDASDGPLARLLGPALRRARGLRAGPLAREATITGQLAPSVIEQIVKAMRKR